MQYFWIILPAILPILMIIRGVLVFRGRLNKELYGTTNKNGFHKVNEFTLPTELHNEKNIEISNLLCGYWTLVIGLILFVCWMIFWFDGFFIAAPILPSPLSTFTLSPKAYPQVVQNFASFLHFAPHFGQTLNSLVSSIFSPQFVQNFAPLGSSCPHFLQIIVFSFHIN